MPLDIVPDKVNKNRDKGDNCVGKFLRYGTLQTLSEKDRADELESDQNDENSEYGHAVGGLRQRLGSISA